MPFYFATSIPWCKKVKNDNWKNSNQGGGGPGGPVQFLVELKVPIILLKPIDGTSIKKMK